MPLPLRCFLVLSVLPSSPLTAQSPPTRVPALIGRMTIEEKFWQLFMVPGQPGAPGEDYRHGVFGLQIPPAASARADAERINAAQRDILTRTSLGIPMIAFEEAVHGLRRPGATMFPQAIALAATWDTALMARVASAIAREARTRGIRQVLAPVVNLATDTTFVYSDLRLTPNPISADGSTLVEFRITNTGTRAGAEIAQLYIRDILAWVTQPVLSLNGFRKVVLQPGESRTLTFSLGPDALSLLGEDLRRVVEPGRFHVYVGASSRDIRLRGILEVR